MQKMDGLMAIALKNSGGIHSLHTHWTFAREHLLLKSEAFDDLKTVREKIKQKVLLMHFFFNS